MSSKLLCGQLSAMIAQPSQDFPFRDATRIFRFLKIVQHCHHVVRDGHVETFRRKSMSNTTTLQVKKEAKFWELSPYAGKPISSMDQYNKNNLRYFVIKSSVSWRSAPWRHNLFLLTSASVQHVLANQQNLHVCKMLKTIHFFKHKCTWKFGNLFPRVQEETEFKNDLSHRLFHCCLSHTEEICFINNI